MRPSHTPYVPSKFGIQSGRKILEYVQMVHEDLFSNTFVRPMDNLVSKRAEVLQLLPKRRGAHTLPRETVEHVVNPKRAEHLLDILRVGVSPLRI